MSEDDLITRKIFMNRMSKGIAGLAIGGVAMSEVSALEMSSLPNKLAPDGQLDHGMKSVRGISFGPDGRLWVVGEGGLASFGTNGERLSTKGLESSGMAVTLDDEGYGYIAEKTRIHRIDPKGKVVATWGEVGKDRGQFQYLTGLAVMGASLYIADAGNRRVHRYAINGDFVGELEGFHIPSAYFDCSTDGTGRLYVGHTSEHRVEGYDRNGERVSTWGEYGPAPEGFCGCCNPTNLAAFPDGKIVTTEKGIPRLKVYDRSGLLLAYLSPEDLGLAVNQTYLDLLQGSAGGPLPCHDGWPGMPVAVDAQGKVAVSVPGSGRVRFYRMEST